MLPPPLATKVPARRQGGVAVLRTVIRAVGMTLVTIAGLSLVVEWQSRQEEAQGAVQAVSPGDGLPTDGTPVAQAPGQGPSSPIAALRAMLLDEPAPLPTEAVEPPEPEGLAVHRGVPEAAPGVQVNRGLP